MPRVCQLAGMGELSSLPDLIPHPDLTPSLTLNGGNHIMKQFQRSDRLGEQIRRDLSILLENELKDFGYGMVTITAVQLSRDLRHAKVSYSFLGSEESRILIDNFFFREARRLRGQIGKNLSIRHIPELLFKFDPSTEAGLKIERLLNEVNDKRKP